MTKEEKQLLLKDLCARLPYGVMAKQDDGLSQRTEKVISIYTDSIGTSVHLNTLRHIGFPLEEVKPYLRPLSSMTKEEKREVGKLGVCDDGAFHNDVYDVGISMEEAFTAISWLLRRHFDINYLIEKGLALEAPEGMYKND